MNSNKAARDSNLILHKVAKKCNKIENLRLDTEKIDGSVGWSCRIHQLHLCKGARHPQRVSRYDTEQSDGEATVMQELWEMLNTPSLPSLPGPLWLGLVARDRVLSMGQIELRSVLKLNWIV